MPTEVTPFPVQSVQDRLFPRYDTEKGHIVFDRGGLGARRVVVPSQDFINPLREGLGGNALADNSYVKPPQTPAQQRAEELRLGGGPNRGQDAHGPGGQLRPDPRASLVDTQDETLGFWGKIFGMRTQGLARLTDSRFGYNTLGDLDPLQEQLAGYLNDLERTKTKGDDISAADEEENRRIEEQIQESFTAGRGEDFFDLVEGAPALRAAFKESDKEKTESIEGRPESLVEKGFFSNAPTSVTPTGVTYGGYVGPNSMPSSTDISRALALVSAQRNPFESGFAETDTGMGGPSTNSDIENNITDATRGLLGYGVEPSIAAANQIAAVHGPVEREELPTNISERMVSILDSAIQPTQQLSTRIIGPKWDYTNRALDAARQAERDDAADRASAASGIGERTAPSMGGPGRGGGGGSADIGRGSGAFGGGRF